MNPGLHSCGDPPRRTSAGILPRTLQFSVRALVGAICGCASLDVPAASRDALVQNSPFDTPPSNLARPHGNLGWELRGVVMEDQEWLFCLHDSASGSSRWLRLNEFWGDVFVGGYSPDDGVVLVAVNDEVLLLRLKRAKIILSRPGEPPPSEESEMQREGEPRENAAYRQALISEIRRRRALHELKADQDSPRVHATAGIARPRTDHQAGTREAEVPY